jgi:hypothetical protein
MAAGGAWTQGCKNTTFPISLYINICRNIDMYITYAPKAKEKEKMVDGIGWGHCGTGHAEF